MEHTEKSLISSTFPKFDLWTFNELAFGSPVVCSRADNLNLCRHRVPPNSTKDTQVSCSASFFSLGYFFPFFYTRRRFFVQTVVFSTEQVFSKRNLFNLKLASYLHQERLHAGLFYPFLWSSWCLWEHDVSAWPAVREKMIKTRTRDWTWFLFIFEAETETVNPRSPAVTKNKAASTAVGSITGPEH